MKYPARNLSTHQCTPHFHSHNPLHLYTYDDCHITNMRILLHLHIYMCIYPRLHAYVKMYIIILTRNYASIYTIMCIYDCRQGVFLIRATARINQQPTFTFKYTSIYTTTCIYTHDHMYIHTHSNVHIYTRPYVYTYTFKRVSIYTTTYACAYTSVYMHACRCI